MVSANALAPAPPIVMPLIVSAALPVFISVAFCAALVVPIVELNVRVPGVSEAPGAAAAVPVPLSVAVCGEPVALSATDRVAEKLVTEDGVNVTEIAQLAPAASELPHVFVSAKALAPAPPMVMPLMVSAALPVFFSVTIWAELVVLLVDVNVNVPGVSVAAGAAAAVTVKVAGSEFPPPGAGVMTTTDGVPGAAMSPDRMVAVSWVELTNVVARALDAKKTTELLMKPVPFTVRVNCGDPATAVLGCSEVMIGAGLLDPVMEKAIAFDVC